jgi:type IV pilus assembly protein PilW
MKHHYFTRRPALFSRAAGFTLIELMVSMVIGLSMIGAMIAVYTNSSHSSKIAQAQVQMTEDGQYALSILAQNIKLAGFNPSQPGRTTTNAFPGNTTSFAVFGCNSDFSDVSVADPTLLVCGTGGGGDAISVSYEADTFNTPATRTLPATPTDCLGQGLPLRSIVEAGVSYDYYVAENRFFVSDGRLFCAGSGDFTNPQPLVENIETIQITYGVHNPNITATKVIGGYLDAAGIGPASGGTAPTNAAMAALTSTGERWNRVMAVRICVVMKSSTPVFSEASSFFGCNPELSSATIPITDGYMRKAFVTTVLLRNRMSLR